MNRRVLTLLSLPLLAWGCVAGLSHAATAWTRAGTGDAPFVEGGPERLLADLEQLAGTGLFARRGERHDAAPVLNRLVAADGPVAGITPAWWAQPDAFGAFGAVKTEWWRHPEVTEAYDLSFLRAWRDFDHWEWASADPFAAHFAANPDQCAPETPLPDFTPFVTMAKIRMAQGLHRDELDEAAADVEALALLAYGTDSLVGALIGVALLGIEEKGLAEGRAAGRSISHTHPWTEDDRRRAKAAFTAIPAVFLHDPGSDVAHALVSRAHELPAVCAGLAEAAWQRSLLRTLVSDPWPGEPDLGVQTRALDTALTRSTCGIASARASWARPQTACLSDVDDDLALTAIGVPYVRAPVLATLLGLSAVNFVGPYGRAP